MGKVIGIDLGTTNSCVAILENGKPVVVPNSEGDRTTPSIIAFGKGNERLVGQLAKRQAITNAEKTVYSIKRFIGRRWNDTELERSRVTYKCVKGRDDTVDVQIGKRAYTPQEISAMTLQKLKADAESFIGEKVTQAVITVPAYFTDAQRQATQDAGTIAGLEVLRIINEPTAAALAYGLDKQDKEEFVLIFDLGGGTFDVSILQLGDGVFEVKATAGNNHLGGDDFDTRIMSWLIENFKKEHNVDLWKDKMAVQRLREAAEKAKIELSSTLNTPINLPFITADEFGPQHIETEISRALFEELSKDLIENTINPVEQALKDAELKASQIDHIILVGGSTRIPAVQQGIKKYFTNKEAEKSVNPDEAVALGAAIQGGVLSGQVEDVLLLDVIPLSLGIETVGEVFTKIIERNTTIPTSKSQVFSTATDGQTSVEVHVLQGERALARDNKSLGKFLMTGIPPARRGLPQIEVSFEIDVNGILKVGARDQGTGKAQSIVISNTGGLSAAEVEKMRQQASDFAEQDFLRLQKIELQNQAEALFYSYQTTLEENRELVTDQLQLRIENRKKQLEIAMMDPRMSLDQLKSLLDSFRDTLLSIGSGVYEPSAQTKQPRQQSSFNNQIMSSKGTVTAPMDSPTNMDYGEMNIDEIDVTGDDEMLEDTMVTGDYESID